MRNPESIKKGEILVNRGGSKYLIPNKKYKVSDIRVYNRNVKIKIEGLNRWLNPWWFRRLDKNEIRELSLDEIFETSESHAVDKSIRKIDTLKDKEKQKIILSIIFNSILDTYRNNLSVIEWAIQKSGKKWNISINDLEPYLGLTIQDIIEKSN